MTERFEIATIYRRCCHRRRRFLASFRPERKKYGSYHASVHNFSKIVSGTPVLRPYWFFDVDQQGDGIADVATHLVDLVQWECFPEQILKKEDVNIIAARRWPTLLSKADFKGVTGFR